jgi:integrase
VKGESVARPKELGQRTDALLDWWGEKTLDDISSLTCKAYAAQRTSPSQARRELEDLRSAGNLAIKDRLCRHAVIVTLPPKPQARADHLDREAVARLLWAAYRKREVQRGKATRKRATLHVARFILSALYTGSRAGRVWNASFVPEEGRPWADLDRGIFHRTWAGEQVPENKRAPAIRIPPRLLAHMRRWRAHGARYVCEYQGRAADPKKAFRRLARTVLADTNMRVVRHTLRHTSTTWLMQAATDKYEASGFLGMSLETLENVYGHHHPDHQKGVGEAFTRGRAGRVAAAGRQ